MRTSRSCTKLLCAGAAAALAIMSASSVTAACSVWWQQRCCAKAGIVGVSCGVPPQTWRCYHNIVSDPAVGSLTTSISGWAGPWAIDFNSCVYHQAACGPSQFPGSCAYMIQTTTVDCVDIAPPSTPPTCP